MTSQKGITALFILIAVCLLISGAAAQTVRPSVANVRVNGVQSITAGPGQDVVVTLNGVTNVQGAYYGQGVGGVALPGFNVYLDGVELSTWFGAIDQNARNAVITYPGGIAGAPFNFVLNGELFSAGNGFVGRHSVVIESVDALGNPLGRSNPVFFNVRAQIPTLVNPGYTDVNQNVWFPVMDDTGLNTAPGTPGNAISTLPRGVTTEIQVAGFGFEPDTFQNALLAGQNCGPLPVIPVTPTNRGTYLLFGRTRLTAMDSTNYGGNAFQAQSDLIRPAEPGYIAYQVFGTLTNRGGRFTLRAQNAMPGFGGGISQRTSTISVN
jgi:hypothetical protein